MRTDGQEHDGSSPGGPALSPIKTGRGIEAIGSSGPHYRWPMSDDAHSDIRELSAPILEWAARRISPGARVVTAERLRPHGGPWLLAIDDDGAITEAVLKCGAASEWREPYRCEAAALRLAGADDISAPRVLGLDADVDGGGEVALLLTRLPGTTRIPHVASIERLRAVGRTAARIHQVPLLPSEELPLRTRHTSWIHLALWRRWARRYDAAPENERGSVVREFLAQYPAGGMAAMTGAVPWTVEAAREVLSTTASTPLLDAAGERLSETPMPDEPMVFVHGDLWQGNTLWEGDRCVGVIDWEVAGAGQPGVDLGCLRWDAAMLFGDGASDEVVDGWEEVSGRPAAAIAYWDLVAVLNYPTDMGTLVSTLRGQGRPDLDARTLTERRDAYVKAALDGLEAASSISTQDER